MNVYIGTYSRLPSTYQEVEYIESSGTQWIDTGVTPTSNTKSQIKFRNLVVSGATIYGMNYNDNTDYRFFNYNSQIYFDFNSNRVYGSTCSANVDYEFEIGNYYVKNVGASSNLISGSTISGYTGGYTIKLNYNDNNGDVSSNRWYYVKIRDGATQVRDLIPCYRKSDSVIGMYDTINDVFYTNSGSGVFTKGSNVYANVLKNAYIGEYSGGYTPTANTIAYYPLNSNANDYSGNGYDLTNSGGVTFDSTGATFSGNYLGRGSTAGLPTGANVRTISFWCIQTDGGQGQQTPFRYGNSSSGGDFWINFNAGGELTFTGNGSSYNAPQTYSTTPGNRYNIIAIYQSNTLYIYVNNTLRITYAKTLNTGNNSLYIGSDNLYNLNFKGKISEVIIENKAWSADKISAYYNQTKADYGL